MKGELIKMRSWAWDKAKIPTRNRTHDLPNTGRALYPMCYENSWKARLGHCTKFIFDRGLVYCLVQHCRSIRTFLCPTLVSCSSIHLSHRCCCCWQCTRIWHFEQANLNSVISISPLFRTQNDFAWISSSVIYYWLFRTPALSNNFFVFPQSKK